MSNLKHRVLRMKQIPKDGWLRIGMLGDPLAGRVSAERRAVLGREAEQSGELLAEQIAGEYPGWTPEAILKHKGGQIHRVPGKPEEYYPEFAFFEPPDEITVYSDNAAQTDRLIHQHNLEPLVGQVEVLQLLLAHELYHLLENRMPDAMPRQKVEMRGMLGNKVQKQLIGLGEIAAMGFAARLCQIRCPAQLMNLLMLQACYPEKAETLYQTYLAYDKELL